MNEESKILIVGPGRCGKDEAGAFCHQHLGVPYVGSTSWAALPIMARVLNLPPQTAWETRHQNRQRWKDLCDGFRDGNPLRLVNLAFWDSDDTLPPIFPSKGRIVTGVRDRVEILAAKEAKLFKHILWIDRPGLPEDPTITFTAADATDYVRNSGDLRAFHRNLARWAMSVQLDGVTLSDYASELLLDAEA